MTSRIQLLDQGSLKCLYKKKLNSKINNEMDKDLSMTDEKCIKGVEILDLLMLILESWRDLSTETIVNC